MLVKYQLVNVPKGGVDHLVGDIRYSITDRLTDQDADKLIMAGLGKYFRLKRLKPAATTAQANDQKETATSPSANPTGGASPSATSGASANQ